MNVLLLALATQVSSASLSVGASSAVEFRCDGQVVLHTHDFSTCASVSLAVTGASNVTASATFPPPPDAGVPPDAGFPDSGVVPDAGFPDSGVTPDAGFPDSGVTPDAGFPDSGVTPDAGVPPPVTYDCGGPLVSGWGTRHQMTVNGETREFYSPAGPGPGPAIVNVNFHGGGGVPELYIPALQGATWIDNMFIISPASRTTDWLDETPANLAFYDAIIACIPQWAPQADMSRVSVTGFSSGAYMASLIVGSRSSTLERALLLSGGIPPGVADSYYLPDNTPVAVVSGGTNDACCGLDFTAESDALDAVLTTAGHPTLRCAPTGAAWGHALPPESLNFQNIYYDYLIGDDSGLQALPYCQ